MLLGNVCRFGLFAVFIALHAGLWVGMFLEWRRERRLRLPERGLPSVSVVVPVRNEAARIGPLLESLDRQDYPRLEIVFVDDLSTDATPALLGAFAARTGARTGAREVRILRLRENPGPNRKQYALTAGLREARGEALLFTDADCELPPGWVRAMAVRLWADERVGAVLGPVLKKDAGPLPLPAPGGAGGAQRQEGQERQERQGNRGSRKRRLFFRRYQCYDHAVRYLYLAGSAGLSLAGGGFGNNLALRRSALEAAGGYAAVPASPTEDAALVTVLRSRTRSRVRAVYADETRVYTASETCWAGLVNQTLRWQTGGLFSPDLGTRSGYAAIMYLMSIETLATLLLPFLPALWPLPAAPALVMLVNTLSMLALLRGSLPRLAPDYILLALFTPVYFTFLTLLSLLRVKFTWKDA